MFALLNHRAQVLYVLIQQGFITIFNNFFLNEVRLYCLVMEIDVNLGFSWNLQRLNRLVTSHCCDCDGVAFPIIQQKLYSNSKSDSLGVAYNESYLCKVRKTDREKET